MHFNKTIAVGPHIISDGSPVFIIAEAGVNHNGDLSVARELIDVAAGAGVQAVKFQAFRTEHLILSTVEKAPYQKKTTDRKESQYDMLKRLELSRQHNLDLMDYCSQKGILFLTTPFDEYSLEELDEFDLPAYKVSSTDLTNLPLLKKIAARKKPVFLSTGMSFLSEVRLALEEIHPENRDVILLQCTANYPISDHEANLNVLLTYQKEFDVLTGYSDHTTGIGASPFAVPMGARVVEKHFTLDSGAPGPDHAASLSPEELCAFVKQVRKAEEFLGSGIKIPTLEELRTRKSLQKCMVASRDIQQGQVITEKDLIAKRTGGEGISPIYYKTIAGRRASRSYRKNDIINE